MLAGGSTPWPAASELAGQAGPKRSPCRHPKSLRGVEDRGSSE